MIKVIALLLACSYGAATAFAAETVVLHDVNLIDGEGGAPRKHMDVVIQDGRIGSVKAAAGQPSHGTVLTLSGRSVLPGLISDHSHLGLTDGKNAGGEYATAANILRQLEQYQTYGVTTVVSLGLNGATGSRDPAAPGAPAEALRQVRICSCRLGSANSCSNLHETGSFAS